MLSVAMAMNVRHDRTVVWLSRQRLVCILKSKNSAESKSFASLSPQSRSLVCSPLFPKCWFLLAGSVAVAAIFETVEPTATGHWWQLAQHVRRERGIGDVDR